MLRILLIVLLAPLPVQSSNNLPDLGSPGLVIYNKQTEIQLGNAFNNALHNQVDLVQDPEINSYIRRIGHLLASHTHEKRHFQFHVINDISINAFAGPNGIIGVHTGLIHSAESEDEIASVLAHEISHVTQLHLARRFERQSNLSLTSFASILAAILIGTQDPSAGMATLMGSTGLSIQNELKHSRINENEADHQGIKLLFKSGYNPHAMADFFGKLASKHQLYGFQIPEILLTHPVSESRLAQAQARAYQFIYKPNKPPSLDFELIKAKLYSGKMPAGFESKYPNTLECYSKLIKNPTASTKCLKKSLSKHPNNRVLRSLEAKIVFQHKPDEAIKKQLRLSSIYPQDYAVAIQLAQLYQRNNQPEKAIEFLESSLVNVRYKYEIYNLLAEIYSKLDNKPYAYLNQGFAQLQLGNKAHAEHMLKQSYKQITQQDNNLNKQLEQLKQKIENSF